MTKRWKHPLNLKTGRLAFTPVLRSTGERLDLEVAYESFPRSKAPGFHGNTQDLTTGRWYAVYGMCAIFPDATAMHGSRRYRTRIAARPVLGGIASGMSDHPNERI